MPKAGEMTTLHLQPFPEELRMKLRAQAALRRKGLYELTTDILQEWVDKNSITEPKET